MARSGGSSQRLACDLACENVELPLGQGYGIVTRGGKRYSRQAHRDEFGWLYIFDFCHSIIPMVPCAVPAAPLWGREQPAIPFSSTRRQLSWRARPMIRSSCNYGVGGVKGVSVETFAVVSILVRQRVKERCSPCCLAFHGEDRVGRSQRRPRSLTMCYSHSLRFAMDTCPSRLSVFSGPPSCSRSTCSWLSIDQSGLFCFGRDISFSLRKDARSSSTRESNPRSIASCARRAS